MNNRSESHRFNIFWEKAKEFLEEDIETAVDDRRHSNVVHVAKVSIRDFKQKSKKGAHQAHLFLLMNWFGSSLFPLINVLVQLRNILP